MSAPIATPEGVYFVAVMCFGVGLCVGWFVAHLRRA